MSPYLPDKLHSSHILWDITKQDDKCDPIWFCTRCGQYAYKRIKHLFEPCRGPLKENTSPWYRLQCLKRGAYPNTGEFWAQPNLSMRSVKQHQADAALTTATIKVPNEQPAALVSEPSMLHVSMEEYGQDMWAEYANHLTHQGPAEVEDVDLAFELDFYGSDALTL